MGRLAGCRSPFTDSMLVALGLRLNLKTQTHGKHGKIRPTENTPPNPQQPATATNSRRRAKTHAPRVSPHSPASIDARFVKIGLVQLSQSVNTTNVTHTLTDYENNGTLYAPRYEEAFLPKGKKRPRSLRSLGLATLWRGFFPYRQKTASVASLLRPCLITGREVHEARLPRSCSRPCAFEEQKK